MPVARKKLAHVCIARQVLEKKYYISEIYETILKSIYRKLTVIDYDFRAARCQRRALNEIGVDFFMGRLTGRPTKKP